jgi:hypothetical protein
MLEPTDQNIGREVNYIVGRAQQRAAHVVSLPPLVLFSTETGDAWMLDPADGSALCLARDGAKQDYRITDTPDQFQVEWNADYRIEGDAFVVAERSGRIRSIAGYPMKAIVEAIQRAKVPAEPGKPADSAFIGYSALALGGPDEGCYEYNGDECYVADTRESLRALVGGAMKLAEDYQTDEVRMSDLLADYGASCGRFCMEPEARKRFEAASVAEGIEYSVEELGEGLVNVEVTRGMRARPDEGNGAITGIPDIPAAEPLLPHITDETPPEAGILKLVEAIKADPAVAERCLALFDAEVKLRLEAHGTLLVWLAFALALAGDRKAFESFQEILRAYARDEEPTLRGHYQTALGCLLLYEESARQVTGSFPFPDAKLSEPFAIQDALELLAPVCRSGDELLRKKVAAEAERLLNHPELAHEHVDWACKVLAAADPKRALDLVPMYFDRCEDPKELKRILKAIRKRGSANDLLVPPWPTLAEDAAGELLGDLEEEDDESDDTEQDDAEAAARIDELVARFIALPQNRVAAGQSPVDVAADLTHAFRVLWDHLDTLPDEVEPGDIEQLMLELLPAKVLDDEAWFKAVGAELVAFYRHMADGGFLDDGEEIVKTAGRCAGPMVRNAADPSRWSPAKGIFSAMRRDGVDGTDPAAADRWVREFNAKSLEERARLVPAMGTALHSAPFDFDAADDDEAEDDGYFDGDDEEAGQGDGEHWAYGRKPEPPPEPDPYSPCPCGSGKKYKWCCRGKDRKGRGGRGI